MEHPSKGIANPPDPAARARAEALKAQGNEALQRGEPARAQALYLQAIAADAQYMPAHYNLANVLRTQRRYDEALTAYARAADLAPDDHEVFVNIGATLHAQGRYEQALQAFDRAATLAPQALEPRLNTAVTLAAAGRHEEALGAYDWILEAVPTLSIARYHRAQVLLLLGRWEQGFLDHEARLDLPGWVPEDLLEGKEEWDGSPLAGRTLLVYPEQGLGDMIQFLRYMPLCKARGARVMVCCPPSLQRLLATCADIDVVARDGEPLPEPFDVYVSVMSLGYVFGRQEQLAPLRLDVPATPLPQLAQATGLKVGVCWQGADGHPRDGERSIPLRRFADALAGTAGASFFSLQVDEPAPEFATPLVPQPRDFLDTANAVRQLDLVVTVDTAVAHLAGTLGVPVLLLVAQSPDWRWGLGSQTTPWYPGVRLLRQAEAGDWSAPLAEARRRIDEAVASR